ncbi:unnamed protein product [Brugia pahangi]|uniref:Very-long-chain 3-oxoacyl-CoA synthase n=1 Tax=Brugia pahangi TaxID=6280 RepID=A0A0N4TTP1_BRUPA|nr:unnamed protein product [Brugia pahangi]
MSYAMMHACCVYMNVRMHLYNACALYACTGICVYECANVCKSKARVVVDDADSGAVLY